MFYMIKIKAIKNFLNYHHKLIRENLSVLKFDQRKVKKYNETVLHVIRVKIQKLS
jgi:hypothetical protein